MTEVGLNAVNRPCYAVVVEKVTHSCFVHSFRAILFKQRLSYITKLPKNL